MATERRKKSMMKYILKFTLYNNKTYYAADEAHYKDARYIVLNKPI